MAEDNRIEVQIVLDDGSIVKGFQKIEDQAKKTGESVGKAIQPDEKKLVNFNEIAHSITESLGEAGASFAKFGVAAAAGAIVFEGLKEIFNLTLEAESIQRTAENFDTFANRAGANAAQLKEELEKAGGGLIDLDDTLKIANKALTEFGDSAEKIPQLLDIAVKSSVTFGGSVEENFQKLVSAVESGNTRQLRAINLFIDSKKALKEYADGLGVQVDQLSQAGRQQAVLNAAVAAGSEKFSSVAIDQNSATVKSQQLSVSVKELNDAFAKIIQSGFGDFIAQVAGEFTNLATAISGIGPETSTKLQQIDKDIAKLQQSAHGIIDTINAAKSDQSQGILDDLFGIKDTINEEYLQAKFDKIKERIAKLQEEKNNLLKTNAPVTPDDKVNQDAINAERLATQDKFDEELIKKQNEVQQAQLAVALQNANAEQEARLRSENEEQIHQDNLNNIIIENANNKYITQAEVNALVEAENLRSANVLAGIEKQKTKKEAEEQKQRLNNYGNVLGQIASLSDNSNSTLATIGKAAAITKATIDGYLAVQNALAVVPYPFNFAAAALVGVAAAANIAKIAATGPGGGSSTFNSSQPTSGGGVLAGTEAPITPISGNAQANTPAGPKVEVNIAGNVLDTRETGIHIVELINNAFQQNGAVVTGAV